MFTTPLLAFKPYLPPLGSLPAAPLGTRLANRLCVRANGDVNVIDAGETRLLEPPDAISNIGVEGKLHALHWIADGTKP